MSERSDKLATKYIEFTSSKEFTKAILDHLCDNDLVRHHVGPKGREVSKPDVELALKIIEPAIVKTQEFLAQLEWDEGQDKPRLFMPN